MKCCFVHAGTAGAQLRKDDAALEVFGTEKLHMRCMGTTNRLVTIAFLTQPLNTDD